jgi:tRNA G18 (ribose-2'-O)-methylase SpoU
VPVSVPGLSDISALGFTTVATIIAGGRSPDDIGSGPPLALLVGNEAHGLPAEMVSACDLTMTIPMTGKTESLNAGVSGAIAMYAVGSEPRPA